MHALVETPENKTLAALRRVEPQEHVGPVPRRQVSHVPGVRERRGDLLRGVNAPHLDEAHTALLERRGDELGGFRLTLRPDNRRQTLLLGQRYHVYLPFRLLLGHLVHNG